MSKKSDAILIHLLNNKVVRRGKDMWKWSERKTGQPSLANAHTSQLFQSDLIEEADNELRLTTWGKIVIKSKFP